MRTKRFENKVVLITGATKGIGKEIALRFAREGARVIVNYSKDDGAAEEMEALLGDGALFYKADISDEKAVKSMFEAIRQETDRIDVLVNNAGIISRASSWDDIDVCQWERIFSVNIIGIGLVCKYAKPLMGASGAIVNISSIYGIWGSLTETAYSLSKAAVINLTQLLAKDFAPTVRVNAVAPGNTKTDMTPSNAKVKEIEQSTLLKRSASAGEIANAVLFLASDESSYITGELLQVDGGYHIK